LPDDGQYDIDILHCSIIGRNSIFDQIKAAVGLHYWKNSAAPKYDVEKVYINAGEVGEEVKPLTEL
jgi:hypothetical protein